MPRLITTAAVFGLLLSPPAWADGSRTVKFEAVTAGTSGGSIQCSLSTADGTQSFSPPARITVAVGADGSVMIKGLSCTNGSITRRLSAIPGTQTAVVVIDFSDSGTGFWFERSDGSSVGSAGG